jgi:hypothetical protein
MTALTPEVPTSIPKNIFSPDTRSGGTTHGACKHRYAMSNAAGAAWHQGRIRKQIIQDNMSAGLMAGAVPSSFSF